jgi:RNA polymerase sigma-70 factor (ECF subfamily)
MQLNQNRDDVSDLTQAFFAKLLEGKSLQRVEKSKGRFRSYLLGAVKHFLADHDDRQRATKRGGDKEVQSISASSTSDDASERTDIIDPRGFPPDAYFDSIETLRQQATTLGDCSRFDALKPWIVTAATPDEAEQAASSLGMTIGAYNVAVHRLRKRFRQVVESHIAETVSSTAEVHEELNYLILALTTKQATSL